MRVGPDGRVYVSLGFADNCSDQYLDEGYPFEDRRGGVLVLIEGRAPDEETRWEPFAAVLRKPVGVAFVSKGSLVPVLEGDVMVAIHGSWGTRPGVGFFGDPAPRRPLALAVRFEDGKANG